LMVSIAVICILRASLRWAAGILQGCPGRLLPLLARQGTK
jgi:hypothetical protein